jgi:hypothetical protein
LLAWRPDVDSDLVQSTLDELRNPARLKKEKPVT